MIETSKGDAQEIFCPHCGAFYGWIIPEFQFWGDETTSRVWCVASNCSKPFILIKNT